MANEQVNKVVYGNDTLIDLTSDTVTANALGVGLTAHNSAGAAIVGDMPTSRAAGIIYPYGGSNVPQGFLACDGASYLRASYPELFAVIGTTYGAADSTHFNVPNLQGKFALGKSGSHALGSTGGEETHTLSVNEMPSHTHELYSPYASAAGGKVNNGWSAGHDDTEVSVEVAKNHDSYDVSLTKTGGGQPHNNMPPFQTIAYIISTGESGLSVQDVITDITTLPLGVQYGGTGANNAAGALANLGAAASSHNHSASNITSGTLPIERGGTGATTAAGACTNLGIVDFIVEQGTDNQGYSYMFFNSGKAIWCKTDTSATTLSFSAWGTCYESQQIISTKPTGMVSFDYASFSVSENTSGSTFWLENTNYGGTVFSTFAVKPISGNSSAKFSLLVIGRWK